MNTTPLALRLLEAVTENTRQGARVIFVSGGQGAGKSTAVRHVMQNFKGAVSLSLDDFYLGRNARLRLAQAVHPLFETRGPPGTHDVQAIIETIARLSDGGTSEVPVPVFDKRRDDTAPKNEWRVLAGNPRLILLEGWLMGAEADPAAPLAPPLNAIEARDPAGAWRRYQEDALSGPYARLWDRADAFIHLEAPGIATIVNWRIEQEETTRHLPPGTLPDADRAWVAQFVMHYQRITERMLAGGKRPGTCIRLDETRIPQ